MHQSASTPATPAPAPRTPASRTPVSPGPVGDSHRVRYLHLVAAARVAALRPTSEQQVADVVRVTVDEEVDTTTFRAIVTDVARDALG